MKSLPRVDLQSVFTFLIPFLLFNLLVDRTQCAPAVEGDEVDGGCYYMFNHYGEGDRILTNEPCLNCTCHNSMLMCYLRVCPFTKPIGQDCTIEKKPDQCCPVISCPQVPVSLVTPSALTSTTVPTTSLASVTGSTELATFERGCEIEGKNYPDGAQVIGDPAKPCELCYCIRNRTACVMQECILHVEGCEPVFQPGVCCPVRYQCDYPLQITDQSTVAGLITTTISSLFSSTPQPGGCLLEGEYYADGSQIAAAGPTPSPCEHCYCMRGEIVCAVQECGTPLENEGANCTAIPPGPGLCCPDKYTCESDGQTFSDELGTTLSSLDPVGSSDPDLQNQGLGVPSADDVTLENQTEAIPVSVEPFDGSTGDAIKELDSSEKVESSTVGQDEVPVGSESSTKTSDMESSSSTKHPEHDIIINEPATNETDIETHSRVSEKPNTVQDLEDESFDGGVTTQKASTEDIQPSEILSDDKKVVDLESHEYNPLEQGILDPQGSPTTEKTDNAPELPTNAPDGTTARPYLETESEVHPDKTESPINPSETPVNDEGNLLETSTESISASSEKPVESVTDKLLESSTENVPVISENQRSTENPTSMDNEESSTDKIMISSEKPFEGSTENLIVSSEKTFEASTDSALESSTTKSIESSTENLITPETAPESPSEEAGSETPLEDKPVVGTDDDSFTQVTSSRPDISESQNDATTMKTATEDESKPETGADEQIAISEDGSASGSQTTLKPLTVSQITGESEGVQTPSEKYSDVTVVPSIDIKDSQPASTTLSTGSDEPGANEKETFDEAVTTLLPEVENNLQSTGELKERIKESQSSVAETSDTSETDQVTTPGSNLIGDAKEGSSSASDLSESPTTHTPSIDGTSDDANETMGEDDKQVVTEIPPVKVGVSSPLSTVSPETVAVSEADKKIEENQTPTSSPPSDQNGFIMGELTVSSTPEAPESLSMHKTSTSSPDIDPSSSSVSSVLPSGSEADNEIADEAGDKISDDPSQPESSGISSKPPSSTVSSELDGPASTSQPMMSEIPGMGVGQEDSEKTTQPSSFGETSNQDQSDVKSTTEQSEVTEKSTEATPAVPVVVQSESGSDKVTEIPTQAGIESESDADKPTESPIKPLGDGNEQDAEKSTETSILPAVNVESDLNKPTETPAKPAGEEGESDVDKVTETSAKLSDEVSASGTDKPTEPPMKPSDEDNVLNIDTPTETPIKLSGEETGSDTDKPTEIPVKLSGEATGLDADKPTETPEKLSEEGIGSDTDKPSETPVTGQETGSDTDNPTETPVKLFGEETGLDADKPTESPMKLSGEEIGADLEKPTESSAVLVAAVSEAGLEKVTEIPTKQAGSESESDMDKPTESPTIPFGDDKDQDSERSTETPVVPAEIDTDFNKATETPVKLSGEETGSDADKPTETPVKLSGEETGSDADKPTETPVKLSGEGIGSDTDKPTETPVKLSGEETGSDADKPTETPVKLSGEETGSIIDKPTETPVKLSGEDTGSDLDKPTESPMKPVDGESELDSEKMTEGSIISGMPQHGDSELNKAPEDQVQDQTDMEKTTQISTDLSSSNVDHAIDTSSQSIGIDNLEKSTESPIQSDSKDIETSSVQSLKPDAAETEDPQKITEKPNELETASQDETEVAATEVPAKPISVQNQVASEIITATSLRPEADEGQSDAEKVTEASVKPVQVGSEKVPEAPSKSVDGDVIKEKVSAGEEVPSSDAIQPDLTDSNDEATTVKPIPDDKGAEVEDKLTTNVTSQPEKDSVSSDNLPSTDSVSPESSISKSPEHTTSHGIEASEGAETTQAPDAVAILIPEQTPVKISQEQVDATTTSTILEEVTSPSEKENGIQESSDAHGGAAEAGSIHDEPEIVVGVTDSPASMLVPESDESQTNVTSEASDSQVTSRPQAIAINDNEQSVISTSTVESVMDSSTKMYPDGTTQDATLQDDQNTESSIPDNKQTGEALTNGAQNLTESQSLANLTTIRPMDGSSDPEAASTVPSVDEGSSTYKPLHKPLDDSTHEPIDTGVTTETSDLKPTGIPVVSDMSETSSEKLHDDSSTDIALTDMEVSPIRVPGEGNCFVEGQTYKNGSSIPPTTPCHIVCACQNSIVHCLLVHCPPPPNNFGDCKPIYRSKVCCPEYDCGGSEGSSVTVTPGPGLGFTKEDVNFVTVTPETPSLESNEGSQDESSMSDFLNTTDAGTSRPLSVSQVVGSSESTSQESEEDKSSSVDSGMLKPIEDPSQETSSDVDDSSQNSISSTTSAASLSEQTSKRPLISEEESSESVNATGEGSMFVSSESPSSVDTSSLSSIDEGILDASKLEEALNITSDTESSPLPPGSYYPVTTTTSVTPSQAAWPYPTSTPASVMSTGACLFDGRVYMSAQQIPRDDPCDFCFCFRGDIICLQQSCPPPIPGCYEEPIPGFCCPRYECPVGNGNVTTQPPLFPPSYYHNQILNGVASGQNPGAIANMPTGPGCEIQGEYYESGQVITSTSGPCLECRCGATGMMECDPRECQPEPMLRKMIAAITSR